MTYLHKFKCLICGLHFIVYSWNEDWPPEGSKTHCPECGNEDRFMYARAETESYIHTFVPGGTGWRE